MENKQNKIRGIKKSEIKSPKQLFPHNKNTFNNLYQINNLYFYKIE